jgi:hypothetical protein
MANSAGMDEVERWLGRERDREDRRPVLEEGLLGGRVWRYAGYRLRYFLAWYGVSTAAHAAIALLLYRAFPRSFSVIFVVYAGVTIAESFWWGALEAMRGRIRMLYRMGKPYLVPAEIGRWLSGAVQLAILIAVGVAGWTAWFAASHYKLTATEAYVMALVLAFAVQIPTRCYHSGMYALRRVYRPLQAILALEFFTLAAILGLRPLLGSWSFPVATLVSALAVASVTLFYTRKSYRLLRLAPERYLHLRRVQLPLAGQGTELIAAGASFALMSLDSLVVLIFFATGSSGGDSLFLLFFIIAPTIRAGFDWARLLYFDLKRLEIRLLGNLRRRFRLAAHKLALVLGVFFWGAASLTGTVVLGRGLGALYWLLLPFFVFRSLFAVVQMDAFAEGAYVPLLGNGCACLAGIVVAGIALRDQREALGAITAVTVLAFLSLAAPRARRWMHPQREPQWLTEWLAQLRSVRGSTRVCGVRLSSEPLVGWTKTIADWDQMRRRRGQDLADQIARRLRSVGRVTIGPGGEIIWFERGAGPRRITDEWLLRRSGGFVQSIRDAGAHSEGDHALGTACDQGLLGRDFAAAVHAEHAFTTVDVKHSFAKVVPNGVVYSPHEPVPARLASLGAREQRGIFSDAVSFARAYRPSPWQSEFDVSAFCEDGQLRLIFVVSADSECAPAWGDLIERFNVHAAVASLPTDCSPACARGLRDIHA